MSNVLQHFAREMKTRRKHAGMSQEAFAEKTGVSIALISEIERGIASPTFQTLEKIARYFDVSVSDMLVSEEESSSVENLKLKLIAAVLSMDGQQLVTTQKFIGKLLDR